MDKILYEFVLKKFAKQEFYNFVFKEYNEKYYYIPKELSYNNAVELLIRQKYSLNDELALLRQKDIKPEEYEVYFQFAEECKLKSKEFLEIRERWEKYNG